MINQEKLFNEWRKISVSMSAVVQNDLTDCTAYELKEMITIFEGQCNRFEEEKKKEWLKYKNLKKITKEYLNSVLKGKETNEM